MTRDEAIEAGWTAMVGAQPDYWLMLSRVEAEACVAAVLDAIGWRDERVVAAEALEEDA